MRKLAQEKQVRMKRHGNLWAQVCDRKNIAEAADKAIKNKLMTKDRRNFLNNKDHLIDAIMESLINETYCFGSLYSFTVFEPKERVIHCPPFYPDRILHHCIMNVTIPLFNEKFTADTYGSIIGRGVTLLNRKLMKVLRRNPDAYYLKIDISKFYPSIDHDVAKAQIRKMVKCKKTLRMFDAIIDVHNEGMPIGSFPSQYIANLVLSPIDHWVKEKARLKHYFRYMDDMLFVLPDKATAHQVLKDVTVELDRLKLTVKNNVRIAPVTDGIDFVGYKFFPTHVLLRKRIKEKMKRTVLKLRKNNVSDAYFMLKTASHFGWCKHANCRNLLRKTFKERFDLYKNKMEFKRLSEKKESQNWFTLPKSKRISIKELFGKDIAILDFLKASIKGEDKSVVKFVFPDNPTDEHYFITRSDVIMDRLERDREHLPFVATVKKVNNYIAYE